MQYNLISALVERWRPETHTFHLPCGESTVTLEDFALQLELPIDGSPVTGISAIAESAAFCYSLLGASPGDDESKFSGLKFTWLKANFEHLSINATREELMYVAQAYIMHIIGGVLMPDANNNKYIPDPPMQVGKVHLINKRGKHGMHWGVVHQRYVAVWDNRMARRPQIDMYFDLQPSLENIQWYSILIIRICRAMIISWARRQRADTIDIFGSYPLQYNTPPGPYPPQYFIPLGPYPLQYFTPLGSYPLQHGTPPGSSSSMPFEPHEFSSMFSTPPPTIEEDVGRHDHPQCERRPP
ncbi:hypothetical protein J1N35_010068 [Gossypium stocksii]|uniref:Aminotransferase-like plant mobile domain-containing protein n=1 Tax=Gossypium stocksii TaxID=47602 RepID=A0A9D3W1M6_9ROSI|nr:hypothetical protein J1N35_010068 [Gossypium stocksii]